MTERVLEGLRIGLDVDGEATRELGVSDRAVVGADGVDSGLGKVSLAWVAGLSVQSILVGMATYSSPRSRGPFVIRLGVA